MTASQIFFYVALTAVPVVMVTLLIFAKDINDDSPDDKPKRTQSKRSTSS